MNTSLGSELEEVQRGYEEGLTCGSYLMVSYFDNVRLQIIFLFNMPLNINLKSRSKAHLKLAQYHHLGPWPKQVLAAFGVHLCFSINFTTCSWRTLFFSTFLLETLDTVAICQEKHDNKFVVSYWWLTRFDTTIRPSDLTIYSFLIKTSPVGDLNFSKSSVGHNFHYF